MRMCDVVDVYPRDMMFEEKIVTLGLYILKYILKGMTCW